MSGKLKELAGEGGEKSQLIATESATRPTQIWLAGLGAFAKAQKEGDEVLQRTLVEGRRGRSKAGQEGRRAKPTTT